MSISSDEEIEAEKILAFLRNHGAVVLRGAPLTVKSLESLACRMFRRFHQPAIRSDRRWADGDGYSSLVRKDTRLLGHAEAYYRPCLPAPDMCMFVCEKAPRARGGETFLIDGAELFQALPRDLVARFEAEGVIYESYWDRQRWQNEFGTSDIDDLCEMLDRDGRCRYELMDSNALHLLFKAAPILQDEQGQKRFINGLLAHLPQVDHPRYSEIPVSAKPSNRMYWGEGEVIGNDVICRLIDAHDSVLWKHKWCDGDLLLFDNHTMLHGREAMETPGERIIYSRFGYWEPQPLQPEPK